MSSEIANVPAHQRPLFSDQARVVRWAVGTGVLLAAIGLFDGLVMVAERHKGPCPNGKIFPKGTTDFTRAAKRAAAIRDAS